MEEWVKRKTQSREWSVGVTECWSIGPKPVLQYSNAPLLQGLRDHGQPTTDYGQLTMAEIKSTLDIIMEKAKKFSMTEEEKQGFKRQGLEGKIKGLVQKTLDGILDSERFIAEVAALEARDKDLVDPILKEELVARLEVDANSEALLKMLKNTAGTAWAAVRKVLDDFEKKADMQKDSHLKTLLDDFKKRGISGSAVLPNLDADPEWARIEAEMKRQLQEEVRKQISSLPSV